MKIEVRYYTKTGNTKKLARAIANAVGTEAKNICAPLDTKADILFLGSSVYAAGVDSSVKDFIRDNAPNIGKIVSFGTAAVMSSTYKQIKELAEKFGIPISDKEFHCRGSFAFLHRNRPNEEDLKRVAEFAENVIK